MNATYQEVTEGIDEIVAEIPRKDAGVEAAKQLVHATTELTRQVGRIADVADRAAAVELGGFYDVVFDGPPSHESGRFVELENEAGRSISAGEWIDRGDGFWALRLPKGAN